jgi:hypothetical protein
VDQISIPRARNTSTPAKQVNVKRRAAHDDDEYDDIYPTRMPSSVRRYRSDVKTEIGRAQADTQSVMLAKGDFQVPARKSAIPPRRTATQTALPAMRANRRPTGPVEMEEVSPHQSGDLPRQHVNWSRFHWSVYVGVAMLVMLVGWVAFSSLANWWQVTQDDWHYGRPRTSQIEVVVGHNDSDATPSHFIALNLQRHVQIIEMPGGDASKAKVYTGPILIGQGQDLAVVTLSFKDVNGDGKLDMIVNIQDSRFVFINETGAFRPTHPGENIHL